MNALWWILFVVLTFLNIANAIWGCTFHAWLRARWRAMRERRSVPAPCQRCLARTATRTPARHVARGEALCAACLEDWRREQAAIEEAQWQRRQFQMAFPGRPLPARGRAREARIHAPPGGAAA